MNKPKTFTDAEIPAHWQHENGGPYRKAPAEFGGEWWYVSPFTASGTTGNNSPWERFTPQPDPKPLPDGFEAIFGKLPEFKDFTDRTAWETARNHWEQNLRQFKGAGRPLWMSDKQQAELDVVYQKWNMGKPHFYGGEYGVMARFPQSQAQDFENDAWSTAFNPGSTIARYQIDLVQSGVKIPVGERHWLVPSWVFPPEDEG